MHRHLQYVQNTVWFVTTGGLLRSMLGLHNIDNSIIAKFSRYVIALAWDGPEHVIESGVGKLYT